MRTSQLRELANHLCQNCIGSNKHLRVFVEADFRSRDFWRAADLRDNWCGYGRPARTGRLRRMFPSDGASLAERSRDCSTARASSALERRRAVADVDRAVLIGRPGCSDAQRHDFSIGFCHTWRRKFYLVHSEPALPFTPSMSLSFAETLVEGARWRGPTNNPGDPPFNNESDMHDVQDCLKASEIAAA